MTGTHWSDDTANLAMLIRWMDAKGMLLNWGPDDYAYLIDKPHKWDTEHADMQAEIAAIEAQDAA